MHGVSFGFCVCLCRSMLVCVEGRRGVWLVEVGSRDHVGLCHLESGFARFDIN